MSDQTYIRRKCRETGFYVILAAPGVELAEAEGWVTICDEHGGCICHETRKLAEQWLSHPKGWCPGCRELEKKNEAGNTREQYRETRKRFAKQSRIEERI